MKFRPSSLIIVLSVALFIVSTALFVTAVTRLADGDTVTMTPLTERQAIAVWCGQHAREPTPTDRRAYIGRCVEENATP